MLFKTLLLDHYSRGALTCLRIRRILGPISAYLFHEPRSTSQQNNHPQCVDGCSHQGILYAQTNYLGSERGDIGEIQAEIATLLAAAPDLRDVVLEILVQTATDPSILGMASHLLYTGQCVATSHA